MGCFGGVLSCLEHYWGLFGFSYYDTFDVGVASAPPNTRSKDKEGPNTARKGREGTARKDTERPTLAGQRQSRRVGMKE